MDRAPHGGSSAPRTALGRAAAADVLEPRSGWLRVAQVAAVVLAGLLIRFAFIGAAGYQDDIVIFNGWFKSIAILPPGQVYAHTPGLNYPPMVVVLYELEARVLTWFLHGPLDARALNLAIKLPPILVDGAGAVLVYALVRRHAAHAVALLGTAFIALNPTIIYDSAFWGQNDSIPTVLALFAMSELLLGRTVAAWISITVALLFKPPVLVLVPLMLLHPFRFSAGPRRSRLLQTGMGVAAALLIVEIVAWTFFAHPNPLTATRHLIGQYVQFSNVFHYTSLNAFNLWALPGRFFAPDTHKVLGLSLHVWSDAVFIFSAAAVYARFLLTRSTTALLEAATLVLLGFFIVLTEMHERYLYYALFFCGALIFKPAYRTAALVLTFTLLLNLEYGLTFMYLDDAKVTVIDRFAFAPWLARLCSILNIAAFGWLLADFFRPALDARET